MQDKFKQLGIVIVCGFGDLTIGDQNEYDNGQRLFYLGVREQMG
jgi:hypothetical protein